MRREIATKWISLKKPSAGALLKLGYEIPELSKLLLLNRGIKSRKEAEKFLNPSYENDIHDPLLIANMKKAVERILLAVKKNEKVVIFSDYDCDGIPAAVILHDFFKKIGFENFSIYIPHRHREGYSLNIPAIEKLGKAKTKLLITLDIGTTDLKEVKRANDLGMEVIIVDHHLPKQDEKRKDIFPLAFAILNSKQKRCKYPEKMLSAAGVTWKLVQALILKGDFNLPVGYEKWLLDMAGLSTIADMVPLLGENRVIAHFGLTVLRKSRRVGLHALLSKAKVDSRYLSEEDIGYTVGPRINSASRMSEPSLAFNLLATTDIKEAEDLARELESLNKERKVLVREILKEAHEIAHKNNEPIIVLGHKDWHAGILGLAANSLAETFGKTSFVWGAKGSPHVKGSCRAVAGVNMVELMSFVCKAGGKKNEALFLDFGGHKEAGGFSLLEEDLPLLEKSLLNAYDRVLKVEKIDGDAQKYDCELSLDDVTIKTNREIAKLAPFGVGNDKPVFLFKDITPFRVETFGAEKQHLKIVFNGSGGREVQAISFFGVLKFAHLGLSVKKPLDMLASLELSYFRGSPELRLRIVDLLA